MSTAHISVRQPAVAGMFYPDNKVELHQQVADYLGAAKPSDETPRALVVPHAGYIYSGPIAASGFVNLLPLKDKIKRVVLFGPSHRVAFKGIAAPTSNVFSTPLGNIPLDVDSLTKLCTLPQVQQLDSAHAQEHSLEVQLPFLQEVLGDFYLVPLVVGDSQPIEVAQVMEAFWHDPGTLIVVSSDLSHYHDYASAQHMDTKTCAAIENLTPEAISYDDACGRNPLLGLLTLARQHDLKVNTLDLRNSGDTAGDKNRVVGYGAWLFSE